MLQASWLFPGYKPKGGNKDLANQVSVVLPSANFGNFGGFASTNPNCFQNNGVFPSAFPNNGMFPCASFQAKIGHGSKKSTCHSICWFFITCSFISIFVTMSHFRGSV